MRAEAQRFELSMLGGPTERRYRAMRPEVEAMPWGTLDPREHPEDLVLAARRAWTLAAFQEHRTGVACAATLQALIAARAPVDLVATATRFALDEMAHVEMCARVATELGGGTEVIHNPAALIPRPAPGLSPLLEASDLVVRFFCVGEAISIPLLHGAWRIARHPLLRAVLGRIVRDEAAHGQFGWTYLDWAGELLGPDDRAHLSRVARSTIDALEQRFAAIGATARRSDDAIHALGWMRSAEYLALARRSLERSVVAPLVARGIDPRSVDAGAADAEVVGLSEPAFFARG